MIYWSHHIVTYMESKVSGKCSTPSPWHAWWIGSAGSRNVAFMHISLSDVINNSSWELWLTVSWQLIMLFISSVLSMRWKTNGNLWSWSAWSKNINNKSFSFRCSLTSVYTKTNLYRQSWRCTFIISFILTCTFSLTVI